MLNDAYELHELVRAEGPLEVYRATDTRTRTGVRVKLLRPEYALQGAVVERFLRGPKVLSKLKHAGLPTVRVDTDDTGIPFVVEESIEGRTLAELLETFPQGLPLGMVAHVFVPLVEALALAHSQGLVHGALDAERVRLLGTMQAPTPKLVELGVANEERSACDPSFRAPELGPTSPATKAADVFSLGVLLYRMLSGELPFPRGSKRLQPLDEVAPQLPASCAELAAACLTTDPKRRLADANALLGRARACLLDRVAALAPEDRSEVRARPASDDVALSVTDRPPPSAAASATAQTVLATPDAAFGLGASDDDEPEIDFRESEEPEQAPLEAPAQAQKTDAKKADAKKADAKKADAKKADAKKADAKKADAKKADAKKEGAAAAELRTISAVAAAFGPLSEDERDKAGEGDDTPEKKSKKSLAKAAAEKLGAKVKTKASAAKAGERRGEQSDASKPSTNDDDLEAKLDGDDDDGDERRSGVAAVLGEKPRDKDAPAQAPATGAKKGPTQGQIAAVALTEAQLNALRAVRKDDDESRDRWLGLFFIVLFLLLLQLGVPLLYEPQMVKAQQLFGPQLRLVGAGFAVTTVIAAVKMWAASIQSKSPIVKITSYTMYAVTGCVVLLVGTLYSTSPSLAAMAGMGRRALPWALSLLFFMFTLGGVFRALSNLAQQMLYGSLVLALSMGGFYGSYRAVFATVMQGKNKVTAAQIAEAQRRARERGEELTPEEIAKQLSDKTSLSDWQEQHSDVNTMTERKEVGASEADDLKATEELEGTRAKNKETLEKLQQALPVPEAAK